MHLQLDCLQDVCSKSFLHRGTLWLQRIRSLQAAMLLALHGGPHR
jgi:hypothetical protein